MKNSYRKLTLLGLVVVVLEIAGCHNNSGNTDSSNSSNSNLPTHDDSSTSETVNIDALKKQVIAQIAYEHNFDPNDVTQFDASVSKLPDNSGNPSYGITGQFTVQTTQPSNIYEAARNRLSSNVCSIAPPNDPNCQANKFQHVVYFNAVATLTEKLNGQTNLNLEYKAGVDETLEQIAQKAAADLARNTPIVLSGHVDIDVINIEGDGSGLKYRVTAKITNNTDHDLKTAWLNIYVNGNNFMGNDGNLIINNLRKGESTNATFNVSDAHGVNSWKIEDYATESYAITPNEPDGHYASFEVKYKPWGVRSNTEESSVANDDSQATTDQSNGSSQASNVPAKILKNYSPEYPSGAAIRGEAGTCTVIILVGDNGSIRDVKILQSSGYRMLDHAAVEAARRFQFSPEIKNGIPVSSYVRIPFTFNPYGSGGEPPEPRQPEANQQPEQQRPPNIGIALPTPSQPMAPGSLHPSFDCTKASTPTEVAICNDQSLSLMDVNVANEYHALLTRATPDEASALRNSQRAWIRLRAQCESDKNCIQQQFANRALELREASKSSSQLQPQQGGAAAANSRKHRYRSVLPSVHTVHSEWG